MITEEDIIRNERRKSPCSSYIADAAFGSFNITTVSTYGCKALVPSRILKTG